ncbi:transcription factor LHW-like [Punica granatum]|uniref:Transcription factor LHW-like n=1 Tax=Punica granatum TaxID=22663 RepID=A0A6P8D7P2_PUNGR|nr:transcription factor LHW-like [Punica granatum]
MLSFSVHFLSLAVEVPRLDVDMGYLLKEALKTLCGVNRWSYAVFWKVGCQNPRLLIWEECYYEPLTSSVPPEDRSRQSITQAEDKLQLLINRMMTNNQICLFGEGIIGRAAFTGIYQWFTSNSYIRDVHPPEVSNEMHHQFSAGIQTVAVIPVSPHGVVQLGSSFSIMENLGFVNDIGGLILQLGCIPGALFSMGSAENATVSGYPRSGLTDTSEVGKKTSSDNMMVDSCKQLNSSFDLSRLISKQSNSLIRKVQENSSITDSAFQSPYRPLEKSAFCPRSLERGAVRAELIYSNPHEQLSHFIGPSNSYSRSTVNCQAACGQMGVRHSIKPTEKQKPSAFGIQNPVNSGTNDLDSMIRSRFRTHGSSVLDSSKSFDASQFLEGDEVLNEFKNYSRPVVPAPSFSAAPVPSLSNLTEVGSQAGDLTELEGIPLFSLSDQLMGYATEVLSGGIDQMTPQVDLSSVNQRMENGSRQAPDLPWTHLYEDKSLFDSGSGGVMSPNLTYEDAFRQSEGDDLFDILGADMKNKIFSGRSDSADSHKLSKESLMSTNTREAGQELYLDDESLSKGGVFSVIGNDHLLDAVVSGAHSASKQNSDDSLSCKTTLTKISSSSVPSSSLAYCQSNSTGKMPEDSFGISKPPAKEETPSSGSLKSGCTKNNEAACSQSHSLCSQISSWVDQGRAMKRDNSILTANSRGPDEGTKPSRKRLKPGENPKPRPKDRQMIQDRLKELRDIVPNGAKCSIDALLERTVKHMLFLQGVTKHVDKLKHIAESKIIDREGRLFLNDDFEGGATWAYEIGSQSGVCPIIVEDLSPPRQFLVEMLCEERGFFLEIADMIRRLELTILTGVMESRDGKIWARFSVEANRDVTRMEVFVSLVRALEQVMKDGAVPETMVDNHLMPRHSFAQTACIPATGMPSSLQ